MARRTIAKVLRRHLIPTLAGLSALAPAIAICIPSFQKFLT
ncbi:hypothetical protein [Streptomyces sp. NPDC101455]